MKNLPTDNKFVSSCLIYQTAMHSKNLLPLKCFAIDVKAIKSLFLLHNQEVCISNFNVKVCKCMQSM